MGVMLTMDDHPGWTNNGQFNGSVRRYRAFNSGRRTWVVALGPQGWQIHGQAGSGEAEPQVFRLGPRPPHVPSSLAANLAGLGGVARWRNPDLWDAVATAIIRQVIRAGQARHLYQRFCVEYGTPVRSPHGVTYLIPSAAQVTELPAEAFADVGMAFKRRPLQAAAKAYLTHGAKWRGLSAQRLVDELQTVPRIGPWTAGAAVADFTHDWSLYPYGDLAVRKWAAAAAPDVDWPEKEEAFATRWREITAGQLGVLTLFTLAWGAHHGGMP